MTSGSEPEVRVPSPTRRQVQLQRAAQASELALRRVQRDLRQLTDDILGEAEDRLVVFRLAPGDEQAQLTSVDFICPTARVTRGEDGEDRAAFTELHADLLWALSMCAGEACPGGLAVAADQNMFAGFPEGHCDHWDGAPAFVFSLEQAGLLDDPVTAPYCCPSHRVPALLERYGLDAPSQRTPHDCDDE